MAATEPLPMIGRLARVLHHPALKIAVPLIVALIAVVMLQKMAGHIRWADVKADLAATKPQVLLAAFGFTVLSFVSISLYDFFGVRAVAKGKLPRFLAPAVGAAGYALSGVLGMSYLTGTALRYKIYSAFGLDLATIAGISAIAVGGIIVGLMLTLGGLLTFHPAGLSDVLSISPPIETAIGLALLGALMAAFLWTATGERSFAIGGYRLSLPKASILIGLTGAGAFDLFGAALVLYVLMPADLVQNFPLFFAVFLLAMALGMASHSPGGLGVFEATIITGLGASGRSDVIAALLVCRMVYSVTPFIIASFGLVIAAAIANRDKARAASAVTLRVLKPVIPLVAAGATLLAGTMLLISGNLPGEGSRLGMLRDLFPLFVVEASHLIGSIAGVLLIVIAAGLYRKRYRAWLMAMALLALGVIASLIKGLDWIEALSMIAALVLLGLCRPAFYRAGSTSMFRLNTRWLVSILCLAAVIFWIGLFAYNHVDYQNALWWTFSWNGDASRFLRASLGAAVVLAIVIFRSLIAARNASGPVAPIPDPARRSVTERKEPQGHHGSEGG